MPESGRTSIKIPDDLKRLLDEVRVLARSKIPRGLRSDQKLILWLATQQARALLGQAVQPPPGRRRK